MPRNPINQYEMNIRKYISTAITTLSEVHSVTQAQLADRSGIPQTTLSGYIKCKSTPNFDRLDSIAEAFNVDPNKIDPRRNPSLLKNSDHKQIEEMIDSNDLNELISIYNRLSDENKKWLLVTAKDKLNLQKLTSQYLN